MKKLHIRIKHGWRAFKDRLWQRLAEALVYLSTLQAQAFLRKNGPITVLIDSSVLGHGVTHESLWIDTGTVLWGGVVPVPTGYSARVPVHAIDSNDRVTREVRFIIGLAELARRGLINFVTSAELQAEIMRHPIGRFRGYGWNDINVFEGLKIPSIDGYHFDPKDSAQAQQERLTASKEEPFVTLVDLLPKKSNLDAWHLHTAHKHKLFCFLALDFPFVERVRQLQGNAKFPQLETRLMLPSELGEHLGLKPIPSAFLSYRNAKWAVHPELNMPSSRRSSRSRKMAHNESGEAPMDKSGSKGPVHELPPVKRIQGALVSYGPEAVNIQYTDKADNWQQLTMSMGDALYLLSLLKSMQLNLDIPFPDDPRNPNAIPVKPSERKQS